MFCYILVDFTDFIPLVSICPMLKFGKLHGIASRDILADLFKNYFKSAKIWWLFAELYKNSIGCFVLEDSTVNTVRRF